MNCTVRNLWAVGAIFLCDSHGCSSQISAKKVFKMALSYGRSRSLLLIGCHHRGNSQ